MQKSAEYIDIVEKMALIGGTCNFLITLKGKLAIGISVGEASSENPEMTKKEKKIKEKYENICVCQKKVVILQAFSSEMARLKAFALQTKAARISSSPQKSTDFRGPRKGKTANG